MCKETENVTQIEKESRQQKVSVKGTDIGLNRQSPQVITEIIFK
jgi:hypothetical protein